MAVMSGALLSAELGVAALLDMAQRRGLHASKHEAEQAWQDVTVEREGERLSAAWQWLFKGHTAASSPVSLLSQSQLPAWVVDNGCVGVLARLAGDGEAAQIDWIEGSPQREAGEMSQALVPVPPLSGEQGSFLPEQKRGPATEAIRVAMFAHAPIFRRVAIATIFINIIAVLSSLFAMQVYDRVVPNFAYATLWYLASGVILAYVLDLLFKYSRLRLMEASTHRLDEALSLHFFERLLSLKLDRRPAAVGTLVAQVRDYESIKAFFTSSTLFALADLPFVVMFIAVIYMIGGPVAAVPTVFVLACIIIGLVVYRPIARLQRLHNDAIVRRQGLLFEAVSGGEVVKANGGEAQFGDIWLRSTRETCDRSEALNTVSSVAQFATQFFQQLGFIGILIVGVYTIETGRLSMGGLIACMILGGRTLSNISTISSLLLQWHHARYSLGVLNNLLASPGDDAPSRQANTRALPLELSISELSYGYGNAKTPHLVVPALQVPEGQRIVVLGRNGSGKSTLLKLLAGVATPSAGQVRIAGLDIEECRPSWLRQVIGYLPQEVRLFSGTLLENLTLGMSMPPEQEIMQALERTGLLPAVQKHPEGLHLPIYEGGSGLSGGQRQLVGLTRMVLHNPRIWLLDEPTSSLDTDAEARLIKLIRELPADRTVIFTTHRQSWLDLAQRVLIVEGGQLKVDAPTEQVKAVAAKSAAASAANSQGGINITTGGA